MQVRVLFFASLRELAGHDELRLDVPPPGNLDALLETLESVLSATAMGELRGEGVRLAVNQELVRPPFQLRQDDEIAFLPPITGG